MFRKPMTSCQFIMLQKYYGDYKRYIGIHIQINLILNKFV